MADTSSEDSGQSWWQWIGNTAAGLYAAKLNSKVQMSTNQALLAQAQNNETLSFLGYELHKKTLLWIAGGSIIAALMFAVLKRR